ncbi:2-keto-4-pentenoate hydratase/2-oxohepta-3-ene-1,7-dioic acid hydratase (catechol pathway) [Nocardioides terrae]|uniref:2-keto-4-pentenoate hydratase/2-oxohepta-3-ene-1,7-dioic acid hydratase (Catechol pathway) n=1 Tax=Nocardioides terrae TaxID=574651 RepID=A0A1I1IEH8_9ACTN|nr:fumarylacetoacetate hydrolase family protein [Nocardioides terrae]SFC34646.1 2-keto-4-pentenoate hydratase/2-oxohepta-3-ene-1,7-dioic acid hydratase (catechol pathway) [Nocardioides terrae]
MRLVTYRHGGRARTGAVVGGDRVLDLGRRPVVDLLADPAALDDARAAAAAAAPDDLPRLADVELLAPVTPGKILCLGYNYRGHVPAGADVRAADPPFPDVFVKTPNVLSAPTAPVRLPRVADDVDYEGEIALVVGRRAHDVPVETAMDHIAGYTLLNDVTDRAWQGRTSQWALGKCFDGFGPLGPAIVTPDEIADPHDLLLEVERDGVVTVSQSTSTMVFPMPFVVHYLSTVMTLEPGDVISTGTPQKLPAALAAHRPLTDGDAVTVRVAGIGELTTVFAAGPDTATDHHQTAAWEAHA